MKVHRQWQNKGGWAGTEYTTNYICSRTDIPPVWLCSQPGIFPEKNTCDIGFRFFAAIHCQQRLYRIAVNVFSLDPLSRHRTTSQALISDPSWTSITDLPIMDSTLVWKPNKEMSTAAPSATTVYSTIWSVTVPLVVPCRTTFTRASGAHPLTLLARNHLILAQTIERKSKRHSISKNFS